MPKGILNKASLVMVPEAPIDGTMPSVFPEDRSGDFTFTRGSNLAATRVASNGLIEKGRENLLLQSNQFDTAWQLIDAGVNSGQTGYDNSSDAWLLRETATTGAHSIRQASGITSGIGTFSFYAKKKDYDYIQFSQSGDGGNYANFNLADGTLGNSNSFFFIDRKIEAVGTDGWYRCSITYTFNAGAYVGISLIRSDVSSRYDSYAGDFTKGTYIQDAQLEVGLVATDYIESGATTGKAGLLENEPRIDFTGGGCGSLLLEPQRTNLIPHSEYFQNNYSSAGALFFENATTSPEGVANATTFEGDGTLTYIRVAYPVTFASASDYTMSVFAKAGTNNFMFMYFEGFAGSSGVLQAFFDLSNGTTPTSGASIEAVGSDGWYRCSLTGTIDTGDLGGNIVLLNTLSASDIFFPTAEDADGKSIYIYGAQLEQGSYPTSYIPTYGSSVTRSAEICSLSSASSIIGQTEGVIYAEVELTEGYDSNQIFFNLSDATFANQMFFQRYNGSLGYKILSGGTTQAENYPITSGTTHKVALLYSEDNIKMFANGSRVSLDTSASIPATNKINLSSYWNGLLQFGGGIKKAVLFPTALTDEECSALTQP